MKSYFVTFERTVQVEVEDNADESQIMAAAVEMYNDPPDFVDMYLTYESITLIVECTEEVKQIG